MQYSSRRSILAVFLLLFFSATAFADTVQGRVASFNSSVLNLTVYDAQNRPYPNALSLNMDSQTRLIGYTNASPPRVKDMVRAQVSQKKNGLWHADSVSKLQGTVLPPPVTSPSPNLMDALKSPTGQTMIRSGLQGAVVGGVSAYASGGKGGKGALVGAGIGALAGLIQTIFNQPPPPAQNAPVYVNQRDDSRAN